MLRETYTSPYPHTFVSQVLPQSLYESAKAAWPQMLIDDAPLPGIVRWPRPGKGLRGRTGRDLMRGDAGYSQLSDDWRLVFNHLRVIGSSLMDEWADSLPASLKGWRFNDDYIEARGLVHASELPASQRLPPNELFLRIDFQEGVAGYHKPVHVDWRRRVIGGVVFFSDAEEQGMIGGDFAVYADRAIGGFSDPVRRLSPKHNAAAFWLSNNQSLHAGELLQRIEQGHRRWLYFAVSSTVSVW